MPRHWVCAVALIIITLGVFGQVWNHSFLWDDDIHITENPYLNPVTIPKLLRFWQEPYEHLYIPLTYTVWGGLALLSEGPARGQSGVRFNPAPFHIANLALHALNVLIIFAILRLLCANDWAACGGALLFALHPVQVEPVAWVSGTKDLLCGFFSLLALWQYLVYAAAKSTLVASGPGPVRRSAQSNPASARPKLHYTLALGAFVLALLAKPSAVAVPLVAWALDRWVLGRSARQSLMALSSWLVLAACFIIITQWAQPAAGTKFPTPLWARPLVASDTLFFYLLKLVFPLHLGPDYGRSPEWVLQQYWIYLTWIIPLGLGVFIWYWRQRWPVLVAAAAVFGVAILPVSGLSQFDFQRISTVADRYLYLAMLGPALAFAWLIKTRQSVGIRVSAALILTVLGVASAVQARYWRDPRTLFSHAVKINPRSWMAHNNLGNALTMEGDLEAAMAHFRRALEIDPAYARAHNNLGLALFKGGRTDEAMDNYRRALEIDPNYAKAHNNLAIVLTVRGDVEGAIFHLRRALELNPSYSDAHFNLGNVLARTGDLQAAMEQFRRVLESDPANAKAYNNLGLALAMGGRTDEAIDNYHQALEIDPNYANAHNNLGKALALRGDLEEATLHFRQALRSEPQLGSAHEGLARALALQGKKEEAVEHYQEAIRIFKSQKSSGRDASGVSANK